MQLSPPPRDEAPDDLAAGLAAFVTSRGQRPAVTVLGATGRAEQGFVTLAQWAAKGAHLLLTDAFVVPGDAVLVDLPPSWQLAAVCSAVWWVGGAVVTDPSTAAGGVVAGIVHETRDAPTGVDPLYVVGDAVDGGTTGSGGGAAAVALGSWAEEVQAFPDQPPPRAATADRVALLTPAGPVTHAALVASLRDGLVATSSPTPGGHGTLGVDLDEWTPDADEEVRLVAARPLATGRTTLVLRDGLDRSTAAADRVTAWA